MEKFPFDRDHVNVSVSLRTTLDHYGDDGQINRDILKIFSCDIAHMADRRGGACDMLSWSDRKHVEASVDKTGTVGGSYAFESGDINIDGFIHMVKSKYPNVIIEYDPNFVISPDNEGSENTSLKEADLTNLWFYEISILNKETNEPEYSFCAEIEAPIAYAASIVENSILIKINDLIEGYFDYNVEKHRIETKSLIEDQYFDFDNGLDVAKINISEIPYRLIAPSPEKMEIPALAIPYAGDSFYVDVKPWFSNATNKQINNCLKVGGRPSFATDAITEWMIYYGHEGLKSADHNFGRFFFDMEVEPENMALAHPAADGWEPIPAQEEKIEPKG